MQLGYQESGEGPVLLLVHGFPLDHTMWSGQLKGLSDLRRVVAVDLRGRGKSPYAGDAWSIDDLAGDLAETIDALGVDQVDLAGHSMGGYIVFSVLRNHPEKVRSLILVDTKPEPDSDEAKEGRVKTAAQVREQGTGSLAEAMIPKYLGSTPSNESKSATQEMFQGVPGETAAADALAMRDRADSTKDLAQISVPTLVIHGEEDALIPSDIAGQMTLQINGSRLVKVPNTGHMAPMEDPESVNRAIREFLEGT